MHVNLTRPTEPASNVGRSLYPNNAFEFLRFRISGFQFWNEKFQNQLGIYEGWLFFT